MLREEIFFAHTQWMFLMQSFVEKIMISLAYSK